VRNEPGLRVKRAIVVFVVAREVAGGVGPCVVGGGVGCGREGAGAEGGGGGGHAEDGEEVVGDFTVKGGVGAEAACGGGAQEVCASREGHYGGKVGLVMTARWVVRRRVESGDVMS